MTVYRAAWICPIVAPPIQDGWVAVHDGRIDAVGGPGSATGRSRLAISAGSQSFRASSTRTRISSCRGCVDGVPPAAEFIDWIKQLLLTRGGQMERVRRSEGAGGGARGGVGGSTSWHCGHRRHQ